MNCLWIFILFLIFSMTLCNYFWLVWVIAVLWFCFTLISAFAFCYSLLQYLLYAAVYLLMFFWLCYFLVCCFGFFLVLTIWYGKVCDIVFWWFLSLFWFFLVLIYFIILLFYWDVDVDGLAIYTQVFLNQLFFFFQITTCLAYLCLLLCQICNFVPSFFLNQFFSFKFFSEHAWRTFAFYFAKFVTLLLHFFWTSFFLLSSFFQNMIGLPLPLLCQICNASF